MTAGEPETSVAPSADETELRQEIELARARLGATVEQLAARADVKGQASAKVRDLQTRMRSGVQRAATTTAGLASKRALPLAVGAAVLVAGYAVIRSWRRR